MAISYRNKEVTYPRQETSTNRLVRAFMGELHLRKGDRVAMLLIEWLCC